MDRKRDDTSPKPQDKHKGEKEVYKRNVFQDIELQGDVDLDYITSHNNKLLKPVTSRYDWKTLDTKATIKQENELRTGAVVRISVNDRGVGGSGGNLVKTSVPNTVEQTFSMFSVSSKNKRSNPKTNISLSRWP